MVRTVSSVENKPPVFDKADYLKGRTSSKSNQVYDTAKMKERYRARPHTAH